MWDSISQICFVFLEEPAHKRSKYNHICSITKYAGPSVELLHSDLDVIATEGLQTEATKP